MFRFREYESLAYYIRGQIIDDTNENVNERTLASTILSYNGAYIHADIVGRLSPCIPVWIIQICGDWCLLINDIVIGNTIPIIQEIPTVLLKPL